MSEDRVQFNTIVASQLPTYVREDFPLVESFLKSYYLGQEYQGGPIDLIENIDRYIKLDETTNLTESAVMSGDITFYGTTINAVSYTHLRAHETLMNLVCRLLLEKKKRNEPYHR